jgi:hypothetical protein
MRFEGQLKSWNAERGFGFIEPADGGQEIPPGSASDSPSRSR